MFEYSLQQMTNGWIHRLKMSNALAVIAYEAMRDVASESRFVVFRFGEKGETRFFDLKNRGRGWYSGVKSVLFSLCAQRQFFLSPKLLRTALRFFEFDRSE